ncbi:hypothetical protein MSAN_00686400 [Mycena sanguinolenta]|uniref:Uncharacterized protein n=1 Tax=Mycena sanguinolenta TaxID=230812 RepID=A0A8H7DEY3_9AGAR|nr:hypothetical protein MSAN_00686400 [Mycena sanguinolenta]
MTDLQLDIELSLRELNVFNSLFTVALVLLTIVILPAIFSRNVRRNALWFTFIGSWLLYCVSGLLLVGHQLGPDPPFGICLLQAALIHSVPTLGSVAGGCFIVDVIVFHTETLPVALVLDTNETHANGDYPSYLQDTNSSFPQLLAFPAFAFFSLFWLSLGIGLQDHTTVNRVQNMFCHINTGLPTLVGSLLSGFSIAVAIAVEIAAGIMIYTSRPTLSDAKSPSDSNQPIARGMVIRICLFSLLTVLGLVLSAVMLFHFNDTDIQGNFLLPILPILVAILFGAQRDIILGWRFWKHESKASQIEAV